MGIRHSIVEIWLLTSLIMILLLLWKMECVLLLLFVCVVLPPNPEFLGSVQVQIHVEGGIQVLGGWYKHIKSWGVVQSKYYCTVQVLLSTGLSLAVQGKLHNSTVRQGILTVLFAVYLYLTVLGLYVMSFSACTTLQTKICPQNRVTRL